MNRDEFEKAYAKRSSLTWAAAPDSLETKVVTWSSKVLVLAISAEYGSLIQSTFDQVEYQHGYVSEEYGGFPAESFAGTYQGTPVTVLHLGITPGAHGGPYMDMVLERLRGGPVADVVVAGECTALQPEIKLGDFVLPLTSIRNDDIHLSYYPPHVPAEADEALSRSLADAAESYGEEIHVGVGWSCSAGAGIFDRELDDLAYDYYQSGVLGNTVEASPAYLLGKLMGIRVSSIWLVADSIFEPVEWHRPTPRMEWSQGWDECVQIAFKALITVEDR